MPSGRAAVTAMPRSMPPISSVSGNRSALRGLPATVDQALEVAHADLRTERTQCWDPAELVEGAHRPSVPPPGPALLEGGVVGLPGQGDRTVAEPVGLHPPWHERELGLAADGLVGAVHDEQGAAHSHGSAFRGDHGGHRGERVFAHRGVRARVTSSRGEGDLFARYELRATVPTDVLRNGGRPAHASWRAALGRK